MAWFAANVDSLFQQLGKAASDTAFWCARTFIQLPLSAGATLPQGANLFRNIKDHKPAKRSAPPLANFT
jgi:hypothetical protein